MESAAEEEEDCCGKGPAVYRPNMKCPTLDPTGLTDRQIKRRMRHLLYVYGAFMILMFTDAECDEAMEEQIDIMWMWFAGFAPGRFDGMQDDDGNVVHTDDKEKWKDLFRGKVNRHNSKMLKGNCAMPHKSSGMHGMNIDYWKKYQIKARQKREMALLLDMMEAEAKATNTFVQVSCKLSVGYNGGIAPEDGGDCSQLHANLGSHLMAEDICKDTAYTRSFPTGDKTFWPIPKNDPLRLGNTTGHNVPRGNLAVWAGNTVHKVAPIKSKHITNTCYLGGQVYPNDEVRQREEDRWMKTRRCTLHEATREAAATQEKPKYWPSGQEAREVPGAWHNRAIETAKNMARDIVGHSSGITMHNNRMVELSPNKGPAPLDAFGVMVMGGDPFFLVPANRGQCGVDGTGEKEPPHMDDATPVMNPDSNFPFTKPCCELDLVFGTRAMDVWNAANGIAAGGGSAARAGGRAQPPSVLAEQQRADNGKRAYSPGAEEGGQAILHPALRAMPGASAAAAGAAAPLPPALRAMPSAGPAASYSIWIGDVELVAAQGDICKEKVDAIVNPANEHMSHGAGVAMAIRHAAGRDSGGVYVVDRECEMWRAEHGLLLAGKLPGGKAAVTSSGRLPCLLIIHVVGPRYPDHTPEKAREWLERAVMAALHAADEEKMQSLSMPAISSGIFGYPLQECAEVLVACGIRFAKENPQSSLRTIRYTNIDAPTASALQQALQAAQSQQQPAAAQAVRGGVDTAKLRSALENTKRLAASVVQGAQNIVESTSAFMQAAAHFRQ